MSTTKSTCIGVFGNNVRGNDVLEIYVAETMVKIASLAFQSLHRVSSEPDQTSVLHIWLKETKWQKITVE